MNINLTVRPPTADDKNFIFSSWLKSYRHSAFAKPQCNAVYYDNYKLIIERLLKKSYILVACSVEDPSQIYGYVVFEKHEAAPLCMHYVYTKHLFRKFGVAKRLISHINPTDKPLIYSHLTDIIQRICKNKSALYVPYFEIYNPRE